MKLFVILLVLTLASFTQAPAPSPGDTCTKFPPCAPGTSCVWAGPVFGLQKVCRKGHSGLSGVSVPVAAPAFRRRAAVNGWNAVVTPPSCATPCQLPKVCVATNTCGVATTGGGYGYPYAYNYGAGFGNSRRRASTAVCVNNQPCPSGFTCGLVYGTNTKVCKSNHYHFGHGYGGYTHYGTGVHNVPDYRRRAAACSLVCTAPKQCQKNFFTNAETCAVPPPKGNYGYNYNAGYGYVPPYRRRV